MHKFLYTRPRQALIRLLCRKSSPLLVSHDERDEKRKDEELGAVPALGHPGCILRPCFPRGDYEEQLHRTPDRREVLVQVHRCFLRGRQAQYRTRHHSWNVLLASVLAFWTYAVRYPTVTIYEYGVNGRS